MRNHMRLAAALAVLCTLLAGCSGGPGRSEPAPSTQSAAGNQPEPSAGPGPSEGGVAGTGSTAPGSAETGEIDRDAALALALENAGVPEEDANHVKVERDRENDIPIFQVEFETPYGDYDFSIAVSDGKIVDADYEVDEEWLDTLGGSPVTLEEAKAIVQGKIPGSDTGDIQIWEDTGGRGRLEGELYYDGMKYEFELDPETGIILDWNADLRE